ncbi:MAG: hypothetical protein H7A47_03735 [Verrucomicrobiales bacterium]|nr:hypothetical protein [Verrucomicrobiales bacterium]
MDVSAARTASPPGQPMASGIGGGELGGTGRGWRRAWRAGVTLAVAGLLGCLWGWRYGLTPLPSVPPNGRPGGMALAVVEPVESGPAWPWLEAAWVLDAGGAPGHEREQFLQAVSHWLETGEVAGASLDGLGLWLTNHASLVDCFEAAMAAAEGPRPRILRAGVERTLRLLAAIPVARAARAAGAGEVQGLTAALDQLTRAYRFQALLTPPGAFAGVYDERGAAELDATLGRTFRRLVLTGPALSPEQGTVLLRSLREATNAVIGFEEAYAGRVRAMRRLSLAHRAPNWRQVTRSFHAAVLLARAEVGEVGAVAFSWLGGGSGGSGSGIRGVAHFRSPAAALCRALQQAVAREADHDRLWDGAVARWLEEVRSADGGTPMGQANRAADALDRRPGWLRWLDRPAVWREMEVIPRPQETLAELRGWLASVEASRLVLALRLYHDRRGEWPATLAELSSAVFPDASPDAGIGRGWRYERLARGWRLRAIRPGSTEMEVVWTDGG